MAQDKRNPSIWHPFLFAVFPILFLYSYNVGELLVSEILIPSTILLLGFSLLGVFLCLWGLGKKLGDIRKAGFITTLFLFLFYSYGHFHSLIEQVLRRFPFLEISLGGFIWGPNKYHVLLYSLIFFGGTAFILRARKALNEATRVGNFISVILVLICFIRISSHFLQSPSYSKKSEGNNFVPNQGLHRLGPEAEYLPNIFYIILDSYAHEDTLREFYDYDNREFFLFLEGKGFIVADKSLANYPFTFLSLTSSLNMRYLDDLIDKVGRDSKDKTAPYQLIRDNQVVRFLRQYGYKFVLFPSGFQPTTQNENADFIVNNMKWSDAFTLLLLDTTILKPFVVKIFREDERERVLATFRMIPEVDQFIPGPKFILAHFLVPHPPFLFGPQGEKTSYDSMQIKVYGDVWKYKKPYLDQLIFVTQKTKEMISRILAESRHEPIIILQSDHGPEYTEGWESPSNNFIREHMRILNAYYLPEAVKPHVYASLSPVNSFRLLFRYFFKADLELLEDISYFSEQERQYNVFDVTKILNDGWEKMTGAGKK